MFLTSQKSFIKNEDFYDITIWQAKNIISTIFKKIIIIDN